MWRVLVENAGEKGCQIYKYLTVSESRLARAKELYDFGQYVCGLSAPALQDAKKKLPTCKPDPVPAQLCATHKFSGGHHLSGPCITAGIWLPTLRHRAGRPRSPVYVAFQHARFTRAGSYLPAPWALTPRFHPHRPADAGRQLFSVALSVNAIA